MHMDLQGIHSVPFQDTQILNQAKMSCLLPLSSMSEAQAQSANWILVKYDSTVIVYLN